jgi:hypothetical protein
LRPRRRHRRRARPAPAHPGGAPADRVDALGLSDQAQQDRQRGGPGHPGLGGAAAAPHACRRVRRRPSGGSRPHRRHRGRQRVDPRVDRGRRPGRGMAHPGAAHRRPRADPCAGLRALVRRPRSRTAGRGHRGMGTPAGHAVRQRRQRDRARRHPVRQHPAAGPAATRVRREPGRHLPRPGTGTVPPLPGRVPLAGARFRRERRRAPRQARLHGMVAGQERRAVGGLRE